jgi:hypothetical protein
MEDSFTASSRALSELFSESDINLPAMPVADTVGPFIWELSFRFFTGMVEFRGVLRFIYPFTQLFGDFETVSGPIYKIQEHTLLC